MSRDRDDVSRRSRWRGIIGLGITRVRRRAVETETRQILLSITGVAISVALVLLVTSVGLGLASQSAVAGEATDYWIVPEGSASSAVTAVEGQRLGQVHTANARIQNIEGVTHSTPVLVSLARFNISGDNQYVLAIGIIPDSADRQVAGMPTGDLSPGDPYYGDGSYNGTRTGETVLSTGSASALDASTGDQVTMASGAAAANRSFTVQAVRDSEGVGIAQLPVMLVHLSELQEITGASNTDSANQILVAADGDVASDLESVYPGTDVMTRSERLGQQMTAARLPLAVAVSAFIVALIVGTLFMVTTLGLDLAADSRNRALLSVLGISRGSLALLLATQTFTVAIIGGFVGIAVWLIGALLANAVATALFGTMAIATLHPLLVVYGLVTAILIGVLAVPYLWVVNRRTTTIDQVGG